ncbi:MAG: MATE family efflux transporter, partial [Clostridia bacterium]|nr:MATE family efflux transporter [Clostridia bacterium]
MAVFVREKAFYKTFFSMVFTIAMQNIIVYAVNLADNVMIGGYSELSLSAVAVVNQIQFMLQMVALGTSNGLTVLSSQYWGTKRTQPIRRVFAVALCVGALLGAAIFLAVQLAPHGVLTLLTDQKAVVEEAKPYLFIVSFSYLPFVFSQLMLALMRSVE